MSLQAAGVAGNGMESAEQASLEQWLRSYLKPLTDRIAQLDGQFALLHSRLMVAEHLSLQLSTVMTEPARIRAVQEVRNSVAQELHYAQQSAGLDVLAQHLQEQVNHLDNSLEVMRAKLAAAEEAARLEAASSELPAANQSE